MTNPKSIPAIVRGGGGRTGAFTAWRGLNAHVSTAAGQLPAAATWPHAHDSQLSKQEASNRAAKNTTMRHRSSKVRPQDGARLAPPQLTALIQACTHAAELERLLDHHAGALNEVKTKLICHNEYLML